MSHYGFDHPEREKAVVDYMARVVAPAVGKRLVGISVGTAGLVLNFEDGSSIDVSADLLTNSDMEDLVGLNYIYFGPEGKGFASTTWLMHEMGGGTPPPPMLKKRWKAE